MKKIIVLMILMIFTFCGCSSTKVNSNEEKLQIENQPVLENTTREFNQSVISNKNFKGAWLSYLELFDERYISTQSDYEAYVSSMLENLQRVGTNNIFVHVRAFADAIYPSEIFPSSALVCEKQGDKLKFDFLQVIIDLANEYGMKVHAWINPYRVKTGDNDFSTLCDNNMAKKWNDTKKENLIVLENGIYFNPSAVDAQKLILDGVRELLENYELDGIHFDDYFYPTTQANIDEVQFMQYDGTITLDDFRRENVNSLVSSVYSLVKSFGEDKIFSISPSGDIAKNYSEHYCDTELWSISSGYVDMIIPQIYFGFLNETLPFEKCLNDWIKINLNENVDLCIGLAMYKMGEKDDYAGSGQDEWVGNDDVISRQIEMLKQKGCDGYSLFSARDVDFSSSKISSELERIKSIELVG